MRKTALFLRAITLLLVLATKPVIIYAESDSIRWQSYSSGMKFAETQNIPIFLHFYADWCRYCDKMAKETFQENTIIEFLNSNFVSIKVNYDTEKELAKKYQVRGLPTTFVIDSKGERLGPIPGYLSEKMLLEMLRQIHNKM
jgi:thioredoxin-related protein